MKKSVLVRNARKYMLIAALIAACIAAGITIAVSFWQYGISEIREIPMSFAVEHTTGINTDTDAIYFGSAPRGSSGRRTIHIESDEDRMVTATALGNISAVVTISENNFLVGPGNRKTLELVATAPMDDPYITTYNGTLRLIFRRI